MTTENSQPPGHAPGESPSPTVSQPVNSLPANHPQASYTRSAPATLVTRTPANPLDAEATRQLLQTTFTPEGYKCPKCGTIETSPEAMIEHLSDEINQAIFTIQDIYSSFKPLLDTSAKVESSGDRRKNKER